ncbi:exodeoxyribonuclease VII small subunit [Ammoniphilus resinae]|uniref:Exodeoxyribonuclease 7 small subunit n=1 Tax=Ammoniphilus resinae TaxID=861532 RepID=A0ABS4GV91_9BACL|nr:exodeoxyribonuclease VII small subunit [Ammoniphilus resinae]MBP1934190.1 exodeoxyribonuclease VII small subunit [Ammoniphilus resinae]
MSQNKELLELSFEEALERLEKIVDTLETGEVPLETAIGLFQDGMVLSQICGQKLEKVEQKIETLLEKDGEIVVQPMELGEES